MVHGLVTIKLFVSPIRVGSSKEGHLSHWAKSLNRMVWVAFVAAAVVGTAAAVLLLPLKGSGFLLAGITEPTYLKENYPFCKFIHCI